MTENISPALRLTYDTSLNPLSFDLVFCLAITKALCSINRLQEKFDLLLVNKNYRDVGVEANYSDDYRERKFRDVIVSTATLCRWVNSIHVIRGSTPVPHFTGPTIPSPDAVKAIGLVPQWQITPMVPKQLEAIYEKGGKIDDFGFRASNSILQRYRSTLKDAVVFHTRVSTHTPSRNSNKDILQKTARLLRSDGISVFFVPDVEDLRSGFSWSDFDAEPLFEAAYDMEARLAVAEAAAANLIYPGGGNTATLHFSPARFLTAGFVDESDRLTSTAFFNLKGPSVGSNPPWLNPVTQVYDWTAKSEVTDKHLHRQLLAIIKASSRFTDAPTEPSRL
jgi:hypothetical protein